MKKAVVLCYLLFLLLPASLFADSLGVEAIVLTTHFSDQRDAPIERYRYKIDEGGYWLLTPGVEVYLDQDLKEPMWGAEQWRITGGYYLDSIAFPAGYFGFGLRWVLLESASWLASLQLGPGIVFRKSWTSVQGYNPDNPYDESDWFLPGYEFKIMPIGDIDLLYRFSDSLEGVWSMVPAYPFVFVQNFGVRMKF